MQYEFTYYKEQDFYKIEKLILASYDWEYPLWGMSRHEFSKGLHPEFTGHFHAWEHTVGVYRLDGEIVACVINEGNYNGEAFFLFDTKERAQENELLEAMIKFARTHNCAVSDDRKKRIIRLFVPEWNKVLHEKFVKSGFTLEDWTEDLYILDFKQNQYDVKLPEGYSFADGNTTPDFYLSNTHRFSFGYDGNDHACEHGEQAFHELRQMKHYKKNLDLCVLDTQKKPVAMAIFWYDEAMPYCELEPLGVVWWERRRGIATAILHEGANRVLELFPNCKGMTGGSQTFYQRIGYEKKDSAYVYRWEISVHPSWEKESFEERYADKI